MIHWILDMQISKNSKSEAPFSRLFRKVTEMQMIKMQSTW